ncbi:hypothetical protein HNP84_003293 [Thermocatellispora tengchongensis]|uniref:Right handed beta helix domain-containing protein n=1 Tax=Thermocatellispora tengchongensis TaxID=1073253 RepID=A0A840P8M9_9ACTN|nr:hypothetical protein [Thermocatellispora tengchongensis]MBB5133567.1 hypothetical protein [Thermocatellispora tengchongensis]
MSTNEDRRRALSVLGVTGAAALALGARPAQAATAKRDATEIKSVTELRTTPGGADGDQVDLLGYHADGPGRGGGPLYWDADATEPDDGGTVFAVTGRATGRWKRPASSRLDLTWFGWRGTGADDDSDRLQKAVDALPAGGTIQIGPGKVRITKTIKVTRAPIVFEGAGHSDNAEMGTQIVLETGTADGFVLTGVRGGGFRDLQMRGVNLKGGAMIRTERAGPETADINYMVAFTNLRFRDGYNGIILRGCNTIRFANCVWNTFTGQQVILLNGVGDDNRADPVEFVQCGIAAGSGNKVTDNIVIDGLGGSIKFFATAVLFGRHGLWLRNTTGAAYPKFVYFEGGGFENGYGVPVLLEAGAQVTFANTYVSSDSEDDNVRIGEKFTGTAAFSGCVIRGTGRNGIDIASTRVTVTGCLIGNNGRTAHASFARKISGIAANGSGGVRVTTTAAHGWESGDRITLSGVGGATGLNAKWTIDVVGETAFDLRGAKLDNAYTGGGEAYRHGAGINIRSTASRVVISGNAIGGLADGVNRQDYGIVSEAADVLVTGNDLSGNTEGAYRVTGAQSRLTRFTGNKGVEQIDGWLTARLGGAVADGLHDLSNLLYADGQRLRVVKVTRRLGAGTCDVRLDADGQSAGGTALPATTSLQTTTLASSFTVDGVSAARRLQLRVLNSAGANGLEVQFGYQIIA